MIAITSFFQLLANTAFICCTKVLIHWFLAAIEQLIDRHKFIALRFQRLNNTWYGLNGFRMNIMEQNYLTTVDIILDDLQNLVRIF